MAQYRISSGRTAHGFGTGLWTLKRAARTDNGPKFASRAFMALANSRSIQHIPIEPGRPTQNGCIESCIKQSALILIYKPHGYNVKMLQQPATATDFQFLRTP